MFSEYLSSHVNIQLLNLALTLLEQLAAIWVILWIYHKIERREEADLESQ